MSTSTPAVQPLKKWARPLAMFLRGFPLLLAGAASFVVWTRWSQAPMSEVGTAMILVILTVVLSAALIVSPLATSDEQTWVRNTRLFIGANITVTFAILFSGADTILWLIFMINLINMPKDLHTLWTSDHARPRLIWGFRARRNP